MSRWQRILTGAAVAAACCLLPGQALASGSQTSMLQDDNQILYSSPSHMVHTLTELKALGVDVVKVSMVWWIVAPDNNSSHRPHFDATDPAAYPAGGWARYDDIVWTAHKLGMRVDFQISPLDPKWGAARNLPREGKALGRAPNLQYFGQFVRAVGRRYSGQYGSPHIPRVSYWSIWNEPNWPNWLNPWHREVHGVTEQTQPPLYRGIADTAWRALKATGHGSDTILIGESSNAGTIPPVTFLEDLYCVGASFHPLTGHAAAVVGCPTKPNRAKFVNDNPALFQMTGWAHHPYGRPANSNQGWITIYNLSSLERDLNSVFQAYGHRRSTGIPLYLTEWDGALHTNPPDPFYKVTLAEQAIWTDQGEYISWRLPFVKTLCQFLLVDDKPNPNAKKGSKNYYNTPSGGLFFSTGKPKPALQAYRLPIWLPVAKPSTHVAVWGQLRPADHHKLQVGRIEFQRKGSHTWTVLRTVNTRNSEGFFLTHVAVGRAGTVRLAWQPAPHRTDYSRAVTVG